MYAEVLVEYGVKSLDREFTYIIPDHLKNKLKKGMKVIVPFGHTKINGFVIKIKNETDLENLKEIISIANVELVLGVELLNLGKYLQEKTLCSLITAYNTMFPSSMKVKDIKTNYALYDSYLELTNDRKAEEYINTNKRSIKANELLTRLINNEAVLKNEYNNQIINKLIDLKLIKLRQEIKYRINKYEETKNNFKLTDEQQNAVNRVKFKQSHTYLIHGVTGSGKTEVYMNLIEKALINNQTAIMLVPEISLTTQIVERFYHRFGNKVAIFHSALSEGEKYDEYHKILRGEVKVVVGTRSAIFVPLENIGIIVIDEEHSVNYKQDNMPRYHVLDMAKKRSEYHNCPLILGSATPSLESYARGLKGVYSLIKMDKRIGEAVLPKITLVDMAPEFRKRNMIISDLLSEKINDRIKKNEQVMILLNRRGFSTIMTCQSCGYSFKCPKCEITLTYHKTSNALRCHYCSYTLLKPVKCLDCKEEALTSYGIGTEKLEEELIKRYPEVNIIRMDADTTTKKGSHEQIIKKIMAGEADIIIGTQMIAKGLDFPKVTLVGVINADDSLNIPDFRSGEYTYSLLAQVSGRAGRSNLNGEVIIQTFNTDNKHLNFVRENDYLALYNYEMNIRQTLKYPPYFYLTSIKVASKEYDKAKEEVERVAKYLKKHLKNVIILGPTTAGIFKINNIYRFQIILKYKDFELIKIHLKYLDDIYIQNKLVALEIDNNPMRI